MSQTQVSNSSFNGVYHVTSTEITKNLIILVTQKAKKLPAMWKTWVRSLDWEDPLEAGMATHSSILAWRIPWTEEPGGLKSMGLQRVGHDRATKHHIIHILCRGENYDHPN